MQLFYRTYGTGVPLIALHGLYASSDSWMGLVHELSAEHQLILVDQRNHGRSPHSQEFSYRLMSEDLRELMDSLRIEKAIIMGHSMGGKTAMTFSLSYPERTKGLIVEDISPLAYAAGNKNVRFHRQIINAMQQLPLNELKSRNDAEERLLVAIPDLTLCRFLLKNLWRTTAGDFEWRINLASLANNLDRIMDKVGGTNPTFEGCSLFIKGAQSAYIQANDKICINRLFPNSSIATVSAAGHWVHIEQQNEFLKFVKKYFYLLKNHGIA